ncbi:MAG: outer membrane protein assembly factor BamE [Alphaproteobacteria bacterium]|nr:outer membrane protein assembly factor BamE [Alphaproteobacteria bacterium]
MREYKHILPIIFGLLVLAAGCTPTVETRGNLLTDSKLAEIKPIISTRADVQTKWGPPTAASTLDPSIWYYLGETTTQQGLFAAEVEKRRLIRVRFDDNDIVLDIAEIDPQLAQDISPVDRKTPTAGKEYTAFQQFVGNIGRFNTSGGGSQSRSAGTQP